MKNWPWSEIFKIVFQCVVAIVTLVAAANDHATVQAVRAYGGNAGTTVASFTIPGGLVGLLGMAQTLFLLWKAGGLTWSGLLGALARAMLAQQEKAAVTAKAVKATVVKKGA